MKSDLEEGYGCIYSGLIIESLVCWLVPRENTVSAQHSFADPVMIPYILTFSSISAHFFLFFFFESFNFLSSILCYQDDQNSFKNTLCANLCAVLRASQFHVVLWL